MENVNEHEFFDVIDSLNVVWKDGPFIPFEDWSHAYVDGVLIGSIQRLAYTTPLYFLEKDNENSNATAGSI